MKLAVISDVHGNLEALEAVLADMIVQKVEGVVCLGDLVGYGADPAAVVKRLRREGIPSVLGNHEDALGRPELVLEFNDQARAAMDVTRNLLDPETIHELSHLPVTLDFHGALCVHGCPPDSVHQYIDFLPASDLRRLLLASGRQMVFVGHTHQPRFILVHQDRLIEVQPFVGEREIPLPPGPCLINVGSVGQPRDDDERARYLIWDPDQDTVVLKYIPYDVVKAAEKILAQGFPEACAQRLFNQTPYRPSRLKSLSRSLGRFFGGKR